MRQIEDLKFRYVRGYIAKNKLEEYIETNPHRVKVLDELAAQAQELDMGY